MEYGKLLKEQFPEDVVQTKIEFGEETVTIAREAVRKILKFLKEDPSCEMNMLSDLTAVDHLAEKRPERFEIIYQLYSLRSKKRLRIKTNLSEKVKMDSLSDLWPIADWLEREVWDMFGIPFEGRSDIKRLFMYEEFVGHPLRKDHDIRKRQPLLGPKN